MAEPTAPLLLIGPSLALGLAIGAYEAIVMHRDVTVPTHRFGHMIHALFLSVIFVFFTMNTEFILTIIPALKSLPIIGTVLGMQIAIGLIAAIKIHAVSKAIPSGGMGLGETWFHSILVGGLIIAAPHVYPIVAPLLPEWLKF